MVTRLRARAESEKPARTRPPTRSIPKYTYSSLSNPSTEIRLLQLLPGTNEDPILVQIDHARLIDRESPTESSLSERLLEGINKALPTGWKAHETWSHRIIYTNLELDLSTWQHPAVRDFMSPPENASEPAPDRSADTPHYEALSYTWGSPKSRKAIFIQGLDGEHRKLLVTKNLALALRHLRSTMTPRTLWIDAICINQEDIKERNTQVKRMASIYSLAHRVVVWLGLGSPSSSLAMSTLEYLGEQIEISHQGNVIHTPGAVERHWYKESTDLPYDVRTWNAVLRLSGRTYFTRVWIMQELHLSNHRTIIQCGSDAMSWMNLRKAFNCLSTKRNLPSFLFRGQLAAVASLANYDAREPYRELTRSIQDRNCSNDRDRVYGLLGLMPGGLRARIIPNYDITVGEVYRQETVAQIEFFQRLDVLGGCGLPGGSNPDRAIDAPSWVPDLLLPRMPSPQRNFASGVSRCYVAFTSPDVAEVSGLQVGTANFVQDRQPWEFGEGIENTKLWAYEDLDRDVYALTLCGMTVKERWQGSPGIVPSLEEWKRFYYGDAEDTDDTDQVITPLFLNYVERCIWSRTLFTTADGQIGLGPETMQTGEPSRDHSNLPIQN
jgi:hypothetical protein